MSIYSDLKFPEIKNRPFFYSDFVSTIDGKVFVKKDGYWPIGSRIDFDTFTYLRAHADVIIDGKGTAEQFAKRSQDTFNSQEFRDLRKKLGKTKLLEYIIVTQHPDEKLKSFLQKSEHFISNIFSGEIEELLTYLKEKGYQTVFINGGPTLLASFLEKNLVDELFLTIAPRIFGNEKDKVITLVEGKLFEPHELKFDLVSVEKHENEVFLRYRNPKTT